MSSLFGVLAGMSLLAIVLMVVIGIAVGALLLMVSFRLVVGYLPSFLMAVAAVVLTTVVSAAVGALVHAVTSGGRPLGLVAQLLIGAAMVHWLLVADDGRRIGYGKACLVQLVYTVMEIVLGVVIAIVAVAMFGAALGAGMHH